MYQHYHVCISHMWSRSWGCRSHSSQQKNPALKLSNPESFTSARPLQKLSLEHQLWSLCDADSCRSCTFQKTVPNFQILFFSHKSSMEKGYLPAITIITELNKADVKDASRSLGPESATGEKLNLFFSCGGSQEPSLPVTSCIFREISHFTCW